MLPKDKNKSPHHQSVAHAHDDAPAISNVLFGICITLLYGTGFGLVIGWLIWG